MCTSFKIESADQAAVVGRTMEFAIDLKSKLTVFPRNFDYKAVAPNDQPGMTWQGKYGVVGMNSLGFDSISDGINESGLYFGALYMPGFTKYQEVPEDQNQKALSQVFDVGKYLLSTCANVAEVKQSIADVLVWGLQLPEIGIMELHFAIHDDEGASIVVEYINGQPQIHDNPIGTMTNSPPFEWHMLNLGNFVNLSANSIPDVKLADYDVKALGNGSGMIGLPGDFTPPSRFVRATVLTQSAIPAQTAEDAEVLAYHIANSFDIVKGLVRSNQNGKESLESTQWLTISDLKNRRYFVRYYNNPAVLRVDLSQVDFTKDGVTHLSTDNVNWYTEVAKTQA